MDLKQQKQNYMSVWHTHTHIHTQDYSAIKKSGILPFVTTQMDLEGYYTKWEKLDKERQMLYDFSYIGDFKK